MSMELQNFLRDLIEIFREKYKETSFGGSNESEVDRSFRVGVNFGYYDILSLIETQLEAFGYDKSAFGEISPSAEESNY